MWSVGGGCWLEKEGRKDGGKEGGESRTSGSKHQFVVYVILGTIINIFVQSLFLSSIPSASSIESLAI